jgi:type II secretory pathway component PulF
MTAGPVQPVSFGYRAQSHDGRAVAGTLDASDIDDATRQLHAMGLRVIEIEPTARPARSGALRGEDFIAFNQQLAHLTGAGLPVEHGLRLIAQDMRRGSLRMTVNRLAEELENGTPLPEAIEKFHHKFPPLYARLVQAGIKSNNLPAILLNVGRHAEMIARLRAAVWRAAAYPLMVLIGVLGVLIFVSAFVIPQLASMYSKMMQPQFGLFPSRRGAITYKPGLPVVTKILLAIGPFVPWVLGGLLVLIVGSSAIWMVLRVAKMDRALSDLATRLPLIGPVLKRNLLARWLDAMHIGTSAGLDLPASIELATEAVGSPAIRRDALAMRAALDSGRAIDSAAPVRFIPLVIPAALELASKSTDLPTALATMAQMYQQQAEIRLSILPALLTPIMLLVVAGVIALVLAGLLLPLFRLLTWLSGGSL